MPGSDLLDSVRCVRALDGLASLDDDSVSCIVTSPPYNKGQIYPPESQGHLWRGAPNISYDTYTDEMSEPEYQSWQCHVVEECLRVLKPDGSLFYNHKPRTQDHITIHPMQWLWRFNVLQDIVWDRGAIINVNPTRFWSHTERIYWITSGNRPKFNRRYAKFKEVWRIKFDTNTSHPAPFPLEIPMRCIQATTGRGDTVLDPFAGSGTTLVAAVSVGRHYIGFDISENYAEMARSRLGMCESAGVQATLERF